MAICTLSKSYICFVVLAAIAQPYTFSASIELGADLPSKALDDRYNLHIYSYTAKGWDYDVIDESILKLNMDYLEDQSVKPYNSSADETILQFPDFAFTTTEVINNRSLAVLLSQRLPSVNDETVPCVIASNDPLDMIVRRLSCMARNMYVYIVAGILERVACLEGEPCREDGQKIYSTAVVFDKNGYLISKYRKYNFINEEAFEKPSTLEPATFTTENNITLGVFMGHDLLFAEPAETYISSGINHFIYLSGHLNVLPFGFSLSVLLGWTYANQKNEAVLSTSGYIRPELGYTGDGIIWKTGSSNLHVSHGSGGLTILATGSSKLNNVDEMDRKQNIDLIVTEGTDFTDYTSVPVPFSYLEVNEISVCHGEEFCCTLAYSMLESGEEKDFYQLVAFQGNRTTSDGKVLFPDETCGLVACSSEDRTSCGAPLYATNYTQEAFFKSISLRGSFSSDKVIPITMDGDNSYFPISTFSFLVMPSDNRYDANAVIDGGRHRIKTFALSSTDFTTKNASALGFATSVMLILFSHMILSYLR